ncbi:uncharacterized protein L201_002537 [Kwoniella dendrophila CBS 6074]|uniref:Aminoglycoside phosphotransferase domain-containing protein n=1 Tax=Kwoniella dendrophila CBS 6074 TaxID=1295534 RepID=A0AAX4JQK3_9TREE
MSFVDCAVPNCIYPALVDVPVCRPCGRRYCFYHLDDPVNPCWILEKQGKRQGTSLKDMNQPEVSQLLELLDTKIITTEIEAYLPGRKVTHIDLKSTEEMILDLKGGFNLMVRIDFDDKSSWFMRIRRRAGRRPYPDEPLRLNLESEVATCQALYNAGVSVPPTYPRPKDSEHHAKLQYCYQRMIPGSSWSSFDPILSWFKPPEPCDKPTLKHITSIAKWYISLERCQFDKIGSPVNENGKIVIGPLIERQPTSNTPPYFSGPFDYVKQRYLSIINFRLSLLRERCMVKVKEELEVYFSLLALKEIVENSREMEGNGPYYMKHGDDHHEHFRSTEEGEITGVIDWEWAYTTSKAEAFSAPTSLIPSRLSETSDDDNLSDREMALAEAYSSLGRPDLAKYVREGRKYSRLIKSIHHSWASVEDFVAMRKAFLGISNDEYALFKTRDKWMEYMKFKYKEDEGLTYFLSNPLPEPKISEQEKNDTSCVFNQYIIYAPFI